MATPKAETEGEVESKTEVLLPTVASIPRWMTTVFASSTDAVVEILNDTSIDKGVMIVLSSFTAHNERFVKETFNDLARVEWGALQVYVVHHAGPDFLSMFRISRAPAAFAFGTALRPSDVLCQRASTFSGLMVVHKMFAAFRDEPSTVRTFKRFCEEVVPENVRMVTSEAHVWSAITSDTPVTQFAIVHLVPWIDTCHIKSRVATRVRMLASLVCGAMEKPHGGQLGSCVGGFVVVSEPTDDTDTPLKSKTVVFSLDTTGARRVLDLETLFA